MVNEKEIEKFNEVVRESLRSLNEKYRPYDSNNHTSDRLDDIVYLLREIRDLIKTKKEK